MDDEMGIPAIAGEALAAGRQGAPTSPGFSAQHRPLLIAALGSLAILWGTWVTHTVLGLQQSAPHLVKVQLADLVREYVQDEARSGMPADEVSAQTTAFLKVLNQAVSAHARSGTVVLLANAVVDGAVPDITLAVRQEVYAHVPHPQPGQAQGLSPTMQQFFDAHGASSAHGQ